VPISIKTHETQLVQKAMEIGHLVSQGKDFNSIEKEIDLQVYKLYNLSYYEVQLIDPGFRLSEEEYNKFEVK